MFSKLARLNPNNSITTRLALVFGGIVTALTIVSYVIASHEVRNGLEDLFRQRLVNSQATLQYYAEVHFLTSQTRIEALTNSTDFIEAVGSGDRPRIKAITENYLLQNEASVFVVSLQKSETTRREVVGMDGLNPLVSARVERILGQSALGLWPHYVLADDELLELFDTDIATKSGEIIGRLVTGGQVSAFMADDLKRLTGFDVVIKYDNKIVAHTNSKILSEILESPSEMHRGVPDENLIVSSSMNGEEILCLAAPSSDFNAEVTFIASVDESIDPLIARIRSLLLLALFGGGGLSIWAMYRYTSKRIGSQVSMLVAAAEEITRGNLDFCVTQQSEDELGVLAGEIERMRQGLVNAAKRLEIEHQDLISSERMAAVGKSAAGIIHDFKNPLAVIQGTVELMSLKYAGDEKLLKQSATITSQIETMKLLTQDILEFSKGKFDLSLEEVTLKDYLQEIVQAHSSEYERASITLTLQAHAECKVKLDTQRFRRVLNNLLNNAKDALAPSGSVNLGCELGDSGLQIFVEDNGPGIPEDIRESLFEPFVTHGKQEGTGLGLSITKKIVEDHGAKIIVTESSSGGARFVISFQAESVVAQTDASRIVELSH